MFTGPRYGKLFGAGDYRLRPSYLAHRVASYDKIASAEYVGFCCTN